MVSSNTGCQKRRRLLMTSQSASMLWEHLRKVWPCGCIPLQEDSMSTEAAQSMRENWKPASFQRQTFADATKHCHNIADLRRWGVAFIWKHSERKHRPALPHVITLLDISATAEHDAPASSAGASEHRQVIAGKVAPWLSLADAPNEVAPGQVSVFQSTCRGTTVYRARASERSVA